MKSLSQQQRSKKQTYLNLPIMSEIVSDYIKARKYAASQRVADDSKRGSKKEGGQNDKDNKGDKCLTSKTNFDMQALNPGKHFSHDKMTALKEFLQLFKLRKDELSVELQRLEEAFSYDNVAMVK